jgi:hypothetical protein
MVMSVSVTPQNDAEHQAMLKLQKAHKSNVKLNNAHSYVPYGGGEPGRVPATFSCSGMYGVSNAFGVPHGTGLTPFGKALNELLKACGSRPI